jgi:phage I-like protein
LYHNPSAKGNGKMKKTYRTVAGTLPAACTAHEDGGAGAPRWFQTFPPYGRYPVGRTIKGAAPDAVFVFDEAAARAIVEDFRQQAARPDWPGVLVDREHFSADVDKASDAMAWARDIRQDSDGSIWTRWDFTPEGERLWRDRVLVSRSPLFLCSPDASRREYRPVELRSIGMTNAPHFKGLSTLAAARAAEVNNNEGEIQMEEILKALGLAEGASPADAVAAIEALKEKASAAEQSASEAAARCRKMECDAFIEANKAKIADVAACREVYMENPEAARKLVAACKAPDAKTQTVLAAARKTPDVPRDGAVATCREQMAALPPAERAAFYREHQADIDAGR